MSKNKLTQHHIIPSSRKVDWFITNTKDNLIMVMNSKHSDFHKFFINQTPQEQLETIYNINSKVISPIAKSIFKLLLNMNKSQFYKEKFLNLK